MRLFDTKIIAVANQKGGVGKTTSAVNIAAYLAVTEIPTLLIDMDPQANATTGAGIEVGSYKKSIYDVLIGQSNIEECIQKTDMEYLDVLPSSAQLVGAEIELVGMFSRELMLRNALSEIDGKYKYIIIDAPPSLGLLTVNVFTSAKSVLIPIQCEYYALEGLSQLLNTIRLVQKHLNKDLEIEGILVTMYDHRLNLSKQVVGEVKEYFGDKVYDTYIKRNVRLGEAPSHGKPILLYDASSTGANNYMNLVSEILEKND
ncbi:MAG: ParA family protein [Candidatus Marinimicrobia bacterium]|nr:ParA family protein [Candidatus Neomarinimicrobiota bacterium]MBL7022531.1 ParA family protein [Candidatus Neomarinimicrobiota bacterium]MBL7108887.1 ParA family protein [Candidatus Neomarinimicrobiota bacterium]